MRRKEKPVFKEAIANKGSLTNIYLCATCTQTPRVPFLYEVTVVLPRSTLAHWCVQRQEVSWFAVKTFML